MAREEDRTCDVAIEEERTCDVVREVERTCDVVGEEGRTCDAVRVMTTLIIDAVKVCYRYKCINVTGCQ